MNRKKCALEDGSIDWLDEFEGEGDNGYSAAFYQTIDTVILGRSTYEHVKILTPVFPYQDKTGSASLCQTIRKRIDKKNMSILFVLYVS